MFAGGTYAKDTLEGHPARQGRLYYGQDKKSHVERKRQIPMAESAGQKAIAVQYQALAGRACCVRCSGQSR